MLLQPLVMHQTEVVRGMFAAAAINRAYPVLSWRRHKSLHIIADNIARFNNIGNQMRIDWADKAAEEGSAAA